MKNHLYKRIPALLAVAAVLLMGAMGAFAAGAVPKPASSVGGYSLQATEGGASTILASYENTAGNQFSVTYSTATKPAQQMGVRQFSTETLLFDCYSDDFDLNSIGIVYYTVGACTVTVQCLDAGGAQVKLAKSTVLPFLEQLQSSAVPVMTATCEKCGGAVYTQGASVGGWKETSSSACSHGGTYKYKDVQNQRNVTITAVCASCGNKTEDAYTQTALYCSYSNSWYLQSVR